MDTYKDVGKIVLKVCCLYDSSVSKSFHLSTAILITLINAFWRLIRRFEALNLKHLFSLRIHAENVVQIKIF